jgi:hypothetical protein
MSIQKRAAAVAVAVVACVTGSLFAEPAAAQVGPARRVTGAPVAADAVHARFVWGAGGSRIVFVNQADEVYYHRVHGNRVDMHIRMRGHTVGVRGDTTKYVIPWDNNTMLVVTQQGALYRHVIRAESVGPPEPIPGAPVGTAGQDPIFMFRVGSRLVNVTRQGEVWAHEIGQTVMPPVRLGRVAIAAPRVVRHVFNIGRTVYIVSDQGEIYAHDVNPTLGGGRLIRSATLELGHANTHFVFVLGNGLYSVNERGELFVHDITQLVTGRAGVRGQAQQAPPTPAPAPAQ